MFKFLKKLFSEPEEEQATRESIKLEELDTWFKVKSDDIFNGLDIRIKDIKNKVKEEIIRTKDNLAILAVAKLHNPKISVRETQFMDGNRKSYILAVNNFLRGIDLDKEGYSSLLTFCDNFTDRLDSFGKSTARPYHILQEFFANESRDIAINIKKLGSFIGELKSAIDEARVHKITGIKDKICYMNNKIDQSRKIETLLNDKSNVKHGLIKNKGEAEKELERLFKGKEYRELNELKASKETLLVSIHEHNAKIVHAFSVMERPIRKLTRVVVEDSMLLQKYIDSPVEALVNDDSMKIISLLKKLENNINNYTLDLKDKKREKVLETIKGLSEEFLREFVNKHNELNDGLISLKKEINDNDTLKKENKFNYELSNLNDNLENVSSEILANEQELSKIDIKEMKKNLEISINELLKMDIVIS